MLKHFSHNLIKILAGSQNIANKYRQTKTSTKDILLSLLTDAGGTGKKILSETGIFLRRDLAALTGGKTDQTTINLTIDFAKFNETSKLTILRAVKTAFLFKSFFVGTEHLLYSAIKDKKSAAYKILRRLNINLDNLEKRLVIVFKANQEFTRLAKTLKNQNQTNKIKLLRPSGGQRALDFFCFNLNQKAKKGQLDPTIGREKELNRLVNILLRRHKNNPLLIGPPGVGKTALIEGLAQRIVDRRVPLALANKQILTLDLAGLVAGTMFRGDFEARIKQVIEETEKSGNTIIFIDEIHNIVGSGNAGGSLDTANILKPALVRGDFQCIGATTRDEYQKYFEQDKALERRFQIIEINEPSDQEACQILNGLKTNYENFHQVKFSLEAIKEAVRLSQRYQPERFLPDKAIDLIDEAAAQTRSNWQTPRIVKTIHSLETQLKKIAKQEFELIKDEKYSEALFLKGREKRFQTKLSNLQIEFKKQTKDRVLEINKADIRKTAENMTSVPIRELEAAEKNRLINLEKILAKSIVGQKEILQETAQTIRRAKAGLSDQNRPLASFLFLGPTGVGKTELAKVIARQLFGGEKNLIKIDMSEFKQGFTSARLIGAPAGYVGYEQGGFLTEKVRHQPYSVVLFDEIEKAHSENINLLLQILEDGTLSDHKGHKVNFRNTIIVLTSNIGGLPASEDFKRLGFLTAEEKKRESSDQQNYIKEQILSELKFKLPPEFINRLDKILVFNKLTLKDLNSIAKQEVKQLINILSNKTPKVRLTVDSTVFKFLAKEGCKSNLGARPLRRLVADKIANPLARIILQTEAKELNLRATVSNNKVKIKN